MLGRFKMKKKINLRAKKVIEQLREKNKRYCINLLGDYENKNDGFEIIMLSNEGFGCGKGESYYGLTSNTISILKKAGIKFEILKRE
jgi:hypothetical protein